MNPPGKKSENPDKEIRMESIKSYTPPRPGDTYEHPQAGRVRLMRSAGGDSWHCDLENGKRLILRIKGMRKIHAE
jgi:hypothetical protein